MPVLNLATKKIKYTASDGKTLYNAILLLTTMKESDPDAAQEAAAALEILRRLESLTARR